MKHQVRLLSFILIALLSLASLALGEDNEAYTRVLDRLTSVKHFSDRPVLFIIGFDTSKSMSIEFDRSKKLTQTILGRYAAPGDSIFIFGFADKPSVLPATPSPKEITKANPDKEIASINESLLSLPRSNAKGTVFGRAKLFALDKAAEYGKQQNVVVLLFSDNNSEVEMGTNERDRLKTLESKVASESETIPLYSQGVSPLWLTLYTNNFPNPAVLPGPDGKTDLDNPRLAWAARRAGSQTLEFTAPASSKLSSGDFEVTVQFLGSVEPKEAMLSVDGDHQRQTTFNDGRANWKLTDIDPGSHLLIAQAVLSDGKIRNAEKEISVSRATPAATPTPPPSAHTPPPPPRPSASPTPPPAKKSEGSPFPIILLVVLALAALVTYFLSQKSVKVRVIGPDSEESFMLGSGKVLRLGGKPRVESETVFTSGELPETVATVKCLAFGKAKVFAAATLQQGSVEIETDEGYTVSETGEILLTTATVTFTNDRQRKSVFTLVKEDASGGNAEDSSHFGSGSGKEAADDDGDWRS